MDTNTTTTDTPSIPSGSGVSETWVRETLLPETLACAKHLVGAGEATEKYADTTRQWVGRVIRATSDQPVSVTVARIESVFALLEAECPKGTEDKRTAAEKDAGKADTRSLQDRIDRRAYDLVRQYKSRVLRRIDPERRKLYPGRQDWRQDFTNHRTLNGWLARPKGPQNSPSGSTGAENDTGTLPVHVPEKLVAFLTTDTDTPRAISPDATDTVADYFARLSAILAEGVERGYYRSAEAVAYENVGKTRAMRDPKNHADTVADSPAREAEQTS